MKNKKRLIVFVVVMVLVLAGGYFGWRQFDSAYVILDGRIIARDSQELDLSGKISMHPDRLKVFTELKEVDLSGGGLTPEAYDSLHMLYPDCDIQWDVPFQGQLYNSHAPQHLSAQSLTDEDVAMLGYLKDLQSFDAEECQDYDQIMALMTLHPNCHVSYSVSMGSQQVSNDCTSLIIEDTPPGEVGQVLHYLPQIENITFLQEDLELDPLVELVEAYPNVAFDWRIDIYGVSVKASDSEIDFSGIPLENTEKIAMIAAVMPNLQKVIMCDCGISNEDMDALCRKFPDIKFVWNVNIGQFITLRTDVTYFMPVKLGYTVTDSDLEALKYCTEIICLDLGHMQITDCSFVANMPHMQYLILADTKISDISPLANMKELKFLELFLSNVTDYSPLLNCTALEDLNICYTQGDSAIIAQMTWLKRLWWTGSSMTYDQLLALIDALPDTQFERPGLSSTGNGWRDGENYYAMRDILGMPYSN